MTVLIQKKTVKLDPVDAKGKGGEADIFLLGDFYKDGRQIAAKVYKTPDHPDFANIPNEQKGAEQRIEAHQKKLPAFPKNLPPEVITPIDFATDRKGRIAGFTLEFLTGYELLIRYAEKTFRQTVSNNAVVDVFKTLRSIVERTHQSGVVLGDFNDLNVMVKTKTGNMPFVRMIDADSFQFGKFLCMAFTSNFVDPVLCVPSSGSGPMLSKPHNENSDWYAFNVMLMQCLLYLSGGPYGGVYRNKTPTKRVNHSDRWQHRITVFHPDVIYPKPATPLGILPDELLHYWSELFVKDKRGEFPTKLLDLNFETCKCGTVHARRSCPNCQVASVRPTEVTQIQGKVKVKVIFAKKGLILHATHQGGRLKYLYHDGSSYRREDHSLVVNGPLDNQMRFRVSGEETLIGKDGSLVTLQDGTVKDTVGVDCYGMLPIFDANDANRFWSSGGKLHRSKEILGVQSSDIIGDVLQNQTQFWVGSKFGFGFYRAGAMSVAFTFNVDGHGINDKVNINIQGQLIDSSCVFTTSLCWFFYTVKDRSRILNYCYVVRSDGTVVASTSAEKGTEPWLDNLRGKLPVGTSLFVPTDDGIVRYDCKSGCIEKTQEFPDTADMVDSDCLLFPANNGICVVSSHEIKELQLS